MWAERVAARSALVVLLLPAVAWPAEEIPLNQDFLVRIIGPENGAPFDTFRSLAQMPDGSLWIGGFPDIAQFDGSSFRLVNRTNQPLLPAGGAGRMFVDRSGSVWASTARGIGRFWEGKWQIYGQGQGWPEAPVKSFCSDDKGRLIATTGAQVLEFRGDRFHTLTPLPNPTKPDTNLICAVDPGGSVWVGWGGSNHPAFPGILSRLRNGTWESVRFPEGGMPQRFTSIARARDGHLWIADSTTVFKLDPVNLRVAKALRFGKELGGPVELLEDSRGYLWAGDFENGLVVFAPDGRRLTSTASDGLLSRRVLSILEDRDGTIWVGGRGLSRFRWKAFQFYGVREGLEEATTYSIAAEPQGTILVAGLGLWRLQNDRFQAITPPAGLFNPTTTMYSVLTDRKGTVWVATFDRGLLRLRDGKFTSYPQSSFKFPLLSALFEDSKSRLWVGGYGGVAKLEDGNLTSELLPINNTPVTQFAEEPSGDIVLGGSSGMMRWSDGSGKWTPFRLTDKGTESVLGLLMEPTGTLWAGLESRGLVRSSGGKSFLFRSNHGLPAAEFTMIFEDGGWLYLGTLQSGILRARKSELEEVAAGRRPRADFQILDVVDGIGTNAQARNTQHAWVRDSKGQLWIARTNGVMRADLSRLAQMPSPPAIRIDHILAYEPGKDPQQLAPDKEIRIPSSVSRFDVSTSINSLLSPSKLRYQYRLGGTRAGWVDLGSTNHVLLDELSPGDYDFQIRASYGHGDWGPPATALLIVDAGFLNRWGLSIAFAVSLAGATGLLIYQFQARRVRRAARQLEEQRALAEESLRSRLLVERTSDLVCFATPGGSIVHMNSAGRNLCGYTSVPSKLLIGDLLDSESKKRVEQEGWPAATRDGTWASEAWLLRQDGKRVPVILVLVTHNAPPDQKPVLLAMTARDVTEQRKLMQSLRELSAKRESTLEEERKRISREIHDELGQQLTALKIDLVQLSRSIEGPFDTVLASVDTALATSRRIASELRPPVLDHFGLSAAIEWQVTEFQKRTKIRCISEVDEGVQPDPQRSLTIFRILQESLTNVARHSGASEARILFHRSADEISLIVSDNGRGMRAEALASRNTIGMLSLQERAASVGGRIEIRSQPGQGTTVEAHFPHPRTGQEAA